MGQSFALELSSVGFLQLAFYDFQPANATGAVVYVNLRAGSIGGPILGSTAAVFIPDGFAFGSITNFFFAAPVTVSPGTTYFLQPVTQPGSDVQWDVVGSADTNAGGSAFFHGTLT
jgi:hypothetical protein